MPTCTISTTRCVTNKRRAINDDTHDEHDDMYNDDVGDTIHINTEIVAHDEPPEHETAVGIGGDHAGYDPAW